MSDSTKLIDALIYLLEILMGYNSVRWIGNTDWT